jgi:hypothetical protein
MFHISRSMDFDNPKHVEEILDILFSLPDESDSETERDEGAGDELNALDDTAGRDSNDASVRQNVLGGELVNDSVVLPSNGSTDTGPAFGWGERGTCPGRRLQGGAEKAVTDRPHVNT